MIIHQFLSKGITKRGKTIVFYSIVGTSSNLELIFFKQIVKKRAQKLILGDNFINKNSDDFLCTTTFLF